MHRRKKPKSLRFLPHSLRQSFSVFRYSGRALGLVWTTSHKLTIALAILTVIAGLLPAAIAYIGKLIVDSVVLAANSELTSHRMTAFGYVGLEAIAVMLLAASQRGQTVCQSLLRVLLGQRVNVLILEKALTLDLPHFEDSELYDKMTQARREASSRPLSLVTRTFGLVRDGLSLVTYGGLLLNFSTWAVAVLVIAAIPPFIAETRFAGEAFRLFKWRSPETRQQHYLETLIAREDYAKEVQLYQLGSTMLQRYHDTFNRLYQEDRDLTIRRGFWGYLLGLLSTLTFYAAYLWIVVETIVGRISLGDMTMYLIIFRQGQSTFASVLTSVGGMYEDNLYLSNLYEFLEQDVSLPQGKATRGIIPGDGIRFDNVFFTYPGSLKPALNGVSLHLQPGEKLAIVGENGSGKTTLIKLLTRLYVPDSGRILLDGLELREWDIEILRQRIGVIFQDFVRYQFTVGENVGVGDVNHLNDQPSWKSAAEKGMALPFIESMPEGFSTQLGRWFRGGQELSGGQWQKIALSRAFMRTGADILVLDEPTAAMDAEAEVQVFNHFRTITQSQMVILISHRFSTVRMADKIVVMAGGEITEQGTHEELLQLEGRYARLFSLQAAGYQ
ncbi:MULTISPECIES: ABC transporter ATP-binding protein [unclassified Coleofasciculus]|uniref:ABC transporter ATP-binding protein n=1 Tax=unclassified Coleofasciculus TaxID=2692782 RepID=UPI00187F13E8|nr:MULTISPECIES: ABC transporter ATP-binding protein [unclassified Coleofasciculus]MBE9126468.1 ABC transporter ATP-binding protein [Coleofasciculus sp. LEGE 07081]MBE9148906.1 ABC transporter ATP-binding protein [Coleofasciculus sp. LEGE 07092]